MVFHPALSYCSNSDRTPIAYSATYSPEAAVGRLVATSGVVLQFN